MRLFILLSIFGAFTTPSAFRIKDSTLVSEALTTRSESVANQSRKGHTPLDGLLTRVCVAELAQKWPPFPHEEDHYAAERETLLIEMWHISDELDGLHFGNPLEKLFSQSRDSLKNDLTGIKEKLKTFQFDADAAWHRCKEGNGMPETYDCVHRRTNEALATAPPPLPDQTLEMQKLAMERLRLEDVLAHKDAFPASHVERYESRRKQIKLKFWSVLPDFSFATARAACRKEALQKVQEPASHVFEELTSVIDDSDDTTNCMEKSGEMCPEGTMPVVNRQVDLAHGTKVATGAAIAFEVGKIVIGGVVGGIVAGPAGVGVGVMKGIGLGAVMPGTTPVTAAAFAWGSRGDEECACFPRECFYDASISACRIGTSEDPSSNNPFSRSVPYLSTKCVEVGNSSHFKCEMKKCEEDDYEAVLKSSVLFGKLGRRSDGLYNCLSKDGHSTGALPLQIELSPEIKNSAKARAEIFEAMSLKKD